MDERFGLMNLALNKWMGDDICYQIEPIRARMLKTNAGIGGQKTKIRGER